MLSHAHFHRYAENGHKFQVCIQHTHVCILMRKFQLLAEGNTKRGGAAAANHAQHVTGNYTSSNGMQSHSVSNQVQVGARITHTQTHLSGSCSTVLCTRDASGSCIYHAVCIMPDLYACSTWVVDPDAAPYIY
jgi:hypothetical protein